MSPWRRIEPLIQDMAEGIIAVDEQGRILLANPVATQVLGLSLSVAGATLSEAGVPGPLAEALRHGNDPAEPLPLKIRFIHNGAELSARIWPVITETTAPGGAVALVQDITSDTQLQRLRENFVANVSHELRGPLATLSAGVEAMHDGLISAEARPRYLSAMLSEIGRLRRLVDDLLELSRLDAGMVRIPLEDFDLRPLCEGLAEKWEPRAAALGLKLTVDVPDLCVRGNYDRVEEVLTNYLENAVRFTAPGDKIRLFAEQEGDHVRVGVADTGIGIGREHLPHIWDRFYKADPSRTRTRGGGTGMGLAIVKQLVELMGGTVAVRSEPGHGSAFSCVLPAVPCETEEKG